MAGEAVRERIPSWTHLVLTEVFLLRTRIILTSEGYVLVVKFIYSILSTHGCMSPYCHFYLDK